MNFEKILNYTKNSANSISNISKSTTFAVNNFSSNNDYLNSESYTRQWYLISNSNIQSWREKIGNSQVKNAIEPLRNNLTSTSNEYKRKYLELENKLNELNEKSNKKRKQMIDSIVENKIKEQKLNIEEKNKELKEIEIEENELNSEINEKSIEIERLKNDKSNQKLNSISFEAVEKASAREAKLEDRLFELKSSIRKLDDSITVAHDKKQNLVSSKITNNTIPENSIIKQIELLEEDLDKHFPESEEQQRIICKKELNLNIQKLSSRLNELNNVIIPSKYTIREDKLKALFALLKKWINPSSISVISKIISSETWAVRKNDLRIDENTLNQLISLGVVIESNGFICIVE